ncbi:hypothetical protein ISN44_As03g014800, partial [Arabidopsis suecica]
SWKHYDPASEFGVLVRLCLSSFDCDTSISFIIFLS